jgi:heme A synthase
VFKVFPKKSLPRKMAVASIAFILSEALVGAGLVLFGLVAENKSMIRGVTLGIHLTNTFLLLAALLGTALSCQLHPLPQGFRFPRNTQAILWRVLALGSFLAAILIGVSGAVAALGDTLFPMLADQSLGDAIRQDFETGSHWLIRLRVLHPTIAICGGILILIYSRGTAALCKRGDPAYRWSLALTGLVLVQWTLGFLNVALRAPTALQLVHLLLADLIWITLCGMTFKYLTNKIN